MEKNSTTYTYIDSDGDTLLEASLSNLKNNTKRTFGVKRDERARRVRVVNYQAFPSLTDKTLLLKANIVGESGKYSVQVKFKNVKFADELLAGFVDIVAMDGQTYYVKQFTSAQTQANVNCNCLDFYYMFSVWNHAKNSLEGDPPPPYIKTTDRPVRNPGEIPGACKHILKMIEFLKGERIMR